jgi:1-deoxy-D-xylulose-5-phosphate synthase
MGINKPLLQLGLPDEFIEHGDYKLLMSKCGLDAAGIAQAISQRFSGLNSPKTEVNTLAIGK